MEQQSLTVYRIPLVKEVKYKMGNKVWGIVIGGHDADPDPTQSGGVRVWIPQYMGPDVKPEHIGFSPLSKEASHAGGSISSGTLDPGACVLVEYDDVSDGSNIPRVISTLEQVADGKAKVPGNIDLFSFVKTLQGKDPRETELEIRIPPVINETQQGRATIRNVKEKGQQHKNTLLDSLPSNGAIFPMAGLILPDIKGIGTATEAFNNILDNIVTPEILGKLPGLNMSLGSVLGSLATGSLSGVLNAGLSGVVNGALQNVTAAVGGSIGGVVTDLASQALLVPEAAGALNSISGLNDQFLAEASREMFSKMPKELQGSFKSMSILMQSIEQSSGALNTGRVDPVTFVTNTAQMMSQVTNISDMASVMQTMLIDKSMHGLDKLGSISIPVETPFGTLPLSLGADGSLTQNAPELLTKLFGAFSKAMTLASEFQGVNPDENLFGGSAETMLNMFGRMGGPSNKAAVEMSKVLNQSSLAKSFARDIKTVVSGGNFFSN